VIIRVEGSSSESSSGQPRHETTSRHIEETIDRPGSLLEVVH
jgi:hypothetical protein